ncbi:MAG: hypothetical protein ACREDO_09125 [Methyloceanibacter sp.]
MDGPSPLRASGLPYEFTRFESKGVVTDEAALEAGETVTIDRGVPRAPPRPTSAQS